MPHGGPAGPGPTAESLLPLVYEELRRLSRGRIAAEHGAVTITPTGLVHEAYLKVAGQEGWADEGHFKAIAVRAMRQVLVERARARQAAKRVRPADVTAAEDAVDADAERTLAIDQALAILAKRNAKMAGLVEARFFGGLEVAEAAVVVGVSARTAARMWQRARAHLRLALGDEAVAPVFA